MHVVPDRGQHRDIKRRIQDVAYETPSAANGMCLLIGIEPNTVDSKQIQIQSQKKLFNGHERVQSLGLLCRTHIFSFLWRKCESTKYTSTEHCGNDDKSKRHFELFKALTTVLTEPDSDMQHVRVSPVNWS